MGLTVRRVKIDSGGYDDNGRYWGIRQRLYYCPEIADVRKASFYNDCHTRAKDQFEARLIFKEKMNRLVKLYPENF